MSGGYNKMLIAALGSSYDGSGMRVNEYFCALR